MSYNYSPVAGTAKRLIEKFGKAVIIRRLTDSGTPWNPTQAQVDSGFIGVTLDYEKNEINGTLIKIGDRKLYLAAKDAAITPEVTDTAIIDGREYSIPSIMALEPGDTALLWEVQLRG
jgi:hypothetical protein